MSPFCFLLFLVFIAPLAASLPQRQHKVIIVGAGMSGIMAARKLSENGVDDFLILEGSDRIGGRMHKREFGGKTVEIGANWIEGVGGHHLNPLLELAHESGLRTFLFDYSNISSNYYDSKFGKTIPLSEVLDITKKQEASNNFSINLVATIRANNEEDVSVLEAHRIFGYVPETPLEMAIDYVDFDMEMAVTSLKSVTPLPTISYYGASERFVADERGYEQLVQGLGGKFLKSMDGRLTDGRLILRKVVREIHYRDDCVHVLVEDGTSYSAEYVILSVSLGVLQSKLIRFKPELPHLENQYPGSNILFVTVTDDEARRIERQSDNVTKEEAMEVLRKIFGPEIPDAMDILVPRWGMDRLQRGSYSNWPIGVTDDDFDKLKRWKILSMFKFDMAIYMKIFLKFPHTFWPSGPGTAVFSYASERRGYYNYWEHLEKQYPGSNILFVTVTDDEARRIERQSDNVTKEEAMEVLRKIFGPEIPDALDIFVPRWGMDRLQRGSYSNWPIGVTDDDFNKLKAPVGRIYFTGEYTSLDYNGYVVREIHYRDDCVHVLVEDGTSYSAEYVILSVSLGVLQSKLIRFKPELPRWKILSMFKFDMAIYMKIFLKFPHTFWPSGPGTAVFSYASERRGYYNYWEHLEKQYPGSNILFVTVTDDEARRIERQSNNVTKEEAMEVLRKIFGPEIPDALDIFVPRWGMDRLQRGSYSNWPIGVTDDDFNKLKAPVGRIYFTGEYTSLDNNGYVHGAYFAAA
ncbi:Polyamine oxidase [Nymphaea thermarum]|nr:Polyamine oxidase [Nymphaea thermarum]